LRVCAGRIGASQGIDRDVGVRDGRRAILLGDAAGNGPPGGKPEVLVGRSRPRRQRDARRLRPIVPRPDPARQAVIGYHRVAWHLRSLGFKDVCAGPQAQRVAAGGLRGGAARTFEEDIPRTVCGHSSVRDGCRAVHLRNLAGDRSTRQELEVDAWNRAARHNMDARGVRQIVIIVDVAGQTVVSNGRVAFALRPGGAEDVVTRSARHAERVRTVGEGRCLACEVAVGVVDADLCVRDRRHAVRRGDLALDDPTAWQGEVNARRGRTGGDGDPGRVREVVVEVNRAGEVLIGPGMVAGPVRPGGVKNVVACRQAGRRVGAVGHRPHRTHGGTIGPIDVHLGARDRGGAVFLRDPAGDQPADRKVDVRDHEVRVGGDQDTLCLGQVVVVPEIARQAVVSNRFVA